MNNNLITYTTPESVGVSSEKIEQFIKRLEDKQLATHSLILARGNQIFFEHYWEPFHREFQHRMYSVSKSFVSLAIGFLEQDDKINLDDPISKYFAKELTHQKDKNMHNQTIRHMLMMSTAKSDWGWFRAKVPDRVQRYFDNPNEFSRPSGMVYEYDSSGSFVLGALVERITGMPFMEYLREKMFREIGVSEKAYCLKCPGGHSWGDSAVLCRPIDLFLVARFVLNGGKWNGKQILNEAYINAATAKQVDNNYYNTSTWNTQGYGYLFWRTYQNSFFFNGMGSQYAVCVPGKDLIMVINSDNQGKDAVRNVIVDSFFELIVDSASGNAVPENEVAQNSLKEYAKGLKLLVQPGKVHSEWEKRINGVTYYLNKNPMGITKFCITFDGDKGNFAYTNEQGDKGIFFGMGYNVFGTFPQEGYSADVGSEYAPGNFYKCAASAAWTEEHKLQIAVQIIDRYFGNMTMTFGFKDREVGVFMHKTAECFLEEYQGYGHGLAREE